MEVFVEMCGTAGILLILCALSAMYFAQKRRQNTPVIPSKRFESTFTREMETNVL